MLNLFCEEEMQQMWVKEDCETYLHIVEFLAQKKFRRLRNIYDIGCGYGPHTGIMLQQPWEYHGIDAFSRNAFYRPVEYDVDIQYDTVYPIPIKTNGPSIALAVYSLGSTDEIDDTILSMQMSQLKKDFKGFICATLKESANKIAKFWRKRELIESLYDGMVEINYFH